MLSVPSGGGRGTTASKSLVEAALSVATADRRGLRRSLTREREQRKEALERERATSEILRVIAESQTDVQPVFEAILKSATELCEAHLGLLDLYDGERLRTVAQRGGDAEFAKWAFERGAFRPASDFIQRVIAEKQPSQIADLRQDSGYRERRPNAVTFVELGGARTFLAVPCECRRLSGSSPSTGRRCVPSRTGRSVSCRPSPTRR